MALKGLKAKLKQTNRNAYLYSGPICRGEPRNQHLEMRQFTSAKPDSQTSLAGVCWTGCCSLSPKSLSFYYHQDQNSLYSRLDSNPSPPPQPQLKGKENKELSVSLAEVLLGKERAQIHSLVASVDSCNFKVPSWWKPYGFLIWTVFSLLWIAGLTT